MLVSGSHNAYWSADQPIPTLIRKLAPHRSGEVTPLLPQRFAFLRAAGLSQALLSCLVQVCKVDPPDSHISRFTPSGQHLVSHLLSIHATAPYSSVHFYHSLLQVFKRVTHCNPLDMLVTTCFVYFTLMGTAYR